MENEAGHENEVENYRMDLAASCAILHIMG